MQNVGTEVFQAQEVKAWGLFEARKPQCADARLPFRPDQLAGAKDLKFIDKIRGQKRRRKRASAFTVDPGQSGRAKHLKRLRKIEMAGKAGDLKEPDPRVFPGSEVVRICTAMQ